MLGTISVEKVEESNNYRIVGPDGTTKYVNDLRELELTLLSYQVAPGEYAALQSELLSTGRASFQIGLGKSEQL